LSFFFSSRRRHTSSKRDWSSDVCSSDLVAAGVICRFWYSIYFSASWWFWGGTIGRSYLSPEGACPGDCTNVWDNLSHRCPPHLWGQRGIVASPACSCQVRPGILCRWCVRWRSCLSVRVLIADHV